MVGTTLDFHYGRIGTSNMRTIKCYKVVKDKFYINNPFDWGHKTKTIKIFDNITSAQWYCEDNVDRLCKEPNESLELQQVFNEDTKVYVLATYTA